MSVKSLEGDMKKLQVGSQSKLARRRLSVAGAPNVDAHHIDGYSKEDAKGRRTESVDFKSLSSPNASSPKALSPTASSGKKIPIKAVAKYSHVGYIPMNDQKVNQDRAVVIETFSTGLGSSGSDDREAFFAVMDGHGSVGHEVSQFVATNLPKYFSKYLKPEEDPGAAINRAFVDTNEELKKKNIDSAFSGTTVIVCYIHNNTIYSCNSGDSRAVLATSTKTGLKAVALSDDQKPERADECERIIASGGRVEACLGPRGEEIGPKRVWLKRQYVPGLAMTRSLGDTVAASVGVIPNPEVWDRELTKEDKFMILASDGVWEFIDNQEAVDIVAKAKSPKDAVETLYKESHERWRKEEEVVDDITAVVVYFN